MPSSSKTKSQKKINKSHKILNAGISKKPVSKNLGKGQPSSRINAEELAWKPVEISERLEDFEGFFGLEEIEGVDVRKENGTLVFFQNTAESDQKVKPEDKPVEKQKLGKKRPETSTNVSKSKKRKRPAVMNEMLESASNKNSNPFTVLEHTADDIDLSGLEWSKLPTVSLSTPILQGLAALGFLKPTAIQQDSLPDIMSGSDVIGKAATGSGKTLAYGIPILENHLQLSAEYEKAKQWPTGLIFAPTRELVHQIVDHLTKLSKYCPISGTGVIAITGGLAIQKQKRQLEGNPSIVVATPGRFLELLQHDSALIDKFVKTETLVLDEADRMLQEGHFQELEKILDLIGRGRISKRQTLVFSATFQRDFMKKLVKKQPKLTGLPSNDEAIVALMKKLQFKDGIPKFIDSNPADVIVSQVVESIIECGATEKDLYLYYFLLTYPGRTMVFVNSVDSVKRISPFLQELNIPAVGLHSHMMQKQRLRALERFRASDRAVLVSTDVAARGLDVPAVQHVVHYHLPRTADLYVHRSGRTARGGAEGVSVLICSADEASGPLIKLRKVLYRDKLRTGDSPAMKIFDIDYDIVTQLKERVTIAKKITDSLNESKHKGKDDSWLMVAADELGVDLEDVDLEAGARKKPAVLPKHQVDSLRAELKQLLQKPVGRRGKYITNGMVNLAQLLVDGNTHESILGHNKDTALQTLSKPRNSKALDKK